MKKVKTMQHVFFCVAISLLLYKKAILQIGEDSAVVAVELKTTNNQDPPNEQNKNIKQTAAFLPNKDSKKKP